MVPRLLLGAAALTLAWGAFAFGAVYDWAFQPLAVALAVVGVACLAVARRGPALGPLALALGAIALATSLQLVPLPERVLSTISPGTVSFLSQYDLSYFAARTPDPQAEDQTVAIPHRPISIAPDSTLIALGLFTALSLFALGMTRVLTVIGIRPAVLTLVALGLALATVGIGQELFLGRVTHMLVYGFWKTQEGAEPFGPFINRNHFAGWMVMVIPLALGLLVESIERAVPLSRLTRGRDLLVLLASPYGGRVLTSASVCIILALSLAMTQSRSGIVALFVGSTLFMAHLIRRQRGSMGTLLLAGSVLIVILVALGGAGLDTAFGRFVQTDEKSTVLSVSSAGGRLGIWGSTARMAAASPLTGFGLNSYGTGMILFQDGPRQLHWREAHNDYLQLAAEGGLLVCLPIAAAIVVFARHVRRRFREAPRSGTTYWLRVGAVVGLLSIAAQAVFEFSLQMPGNAALFAMLVGMALHQSPHLRRS